VQIPHRALVQLPRDDAGATRDSPRSIVLLAVTSLSFDIAGLELFLPLVTGRRGLVASAP
jgi:non-ribosomal peptide synthetase component F